MGASSSTLANDVCSNPPLVGYQKRDDKNNAALQREAPKLTATEDSGSVVMEQQQYSGDRVPCPSSSTDCNASASSIESVNEKKNCYQLNLGPQHSNSKDESFASNDDSSSDMSILGLNCRTSLDIFRSPAPAVRDESGSENMKDIFCGTHDFDDDELNDSFSPLRIHRAKLHTGSSADDAGVKMISQNRMRKKSGNSTMYICRNHNNHYDDVEHLISTVQNDEKKKLKQLQIQHEYQSQRINRPISPTSPVPLQQSSINTQAGCNACCASGSDIVSILGSFLCSGPNECFGPSTENSKS